MKSSLLILLGFASQALCQGNGPVTEGQNALVIWSNSDFDANTECTGTVEESMYSGISSQLCYSINLYEGPSIDGTPLSAQLATDNATQIFFYQDNRCQDGGTTEIPPNAEVCTVAGYGNAFSEEQNDGGENSVVFMPTGATASKRGDNLPDGAVMIDGVVRDPVWYAKMEVLRAKQRARREQIKKKQQEKREQEEVTKRQSAYSVWYLKCNYATLAGCVNAGAHCKDDGTFVTATYDDESTDTAFACNAFCSCRQATFTAGPFKE